MAPVQRPRGARDTAGRLARRRYVMSARPSRDSPTRCCMADPTCSLAMAQRELGIAFGRAGGRGRLRGFKLPPLSGGWRCGLQGFFGRPDKRPPRRTIDSVRCLSATRRWRGLRAPTLPAAARRRPSPRRRYFPTSEQQPGRRPQGTRTASRLWRRSLRVADGPFSSGDASTTWSMRRRVPSRDCSDDGDSATRGAPAGRWRLAYGPPATPPRIGRIRLR